MKYDLSKVEKGILRSIRTAPLRQVGGVFGTKMRAEVEYPQFKVTRVVDRLSGDEEVTFEKK